MVWYWRKAVSYTHLDVYKRQGYHIRLGVDTTYVQGDSEVGLVIMRYAEALLS